MHALNCYFHVAVAAFHCMTHTGHRSVIVIVIAVVKQERMISV